MTFTWTWDVPTNRLTVVCTGLAPTTEYALGLEGVFGSGGGAGVTGISSGGGALTLELTDWVPMGPGNMFYAILSVNATSVPVAVNVFSALVSSAGDGVTASFSHDGANGYSVQVQTINGRTYLLEADTNGVSGAGGGLTWVGNGTLETKTFDASGNPFSGGDIVRVSLCDYSNRQTGNGGPIIAAGMQVQGVAGAATGENPGGGTYDPAYIGAGKPIEGSWTLAYNGTTTLTAVGTGLVPGRLYGLVLDGCSDNFTEVGTADGSGHVTIVQTGITDPSTCFGGGPGMQAVVLGGVAFNSAGPGYFGGLGKLTKIFQYGTPSAGTAGIGSWTFDGVEFGSVAFQTTVGVSYDIGDYGIGRIFNITGPIVGDGTVMTINWRIRNPTLVDENDALASQTVLSLFNNSVYEDLGAHVFSYGHAFPVVHPTVLVSSPPWRFVVAKLNSATVTFLDRLATKRTVTYVLNTPAVATGDVPSDDPEVNILQAGQPFLTYGDRLLFGFRREGHPTPWVIRFAGILMQLEREADADQPVSHYTAFDPWQYWALNRPVVNGIGLLPGRGGLTFTNTRGSVIALALLNDSLAAHGSLYADWGQTPFYEGTIEATDHLDIVFQQSTTLGDALTQLTDTGSIDIILKPIYDPINRPGICVEVSIYKQAGSKRNGAIFAWDMPSRSLVGLDLLHDGAQLANKVALWTSTANQPVPVQSDAASISRYGQYWLLKSLAAQSTIAAAELLALAEVALRRRGKTTLTMDPSPERSPSPFVEYFLGDEVPVYASDDFGGALNAGVVVDGEWTKLLRVNAIPLDIGDDEVETVTGMLMSGEPGEAG